MPRPDAAEDYYDSPEEAIDDALNLTFQGTWEQQERCKQELLANLQNYGFKIIKDIEHPIWQTEDSDASS